MIEVVPNPKVRAKLNKIGLKQVGDISWPEHIGMFTLPFRIAVEFNIPLIVYGENSNSEMHQDTYASVAKGFIYLQDVYDGNSPFEYIFLTNLSLISG